MKKFLSIAIMLITLASSCNKKIDVIGVLLNHETLTLAVSETETLIATVLPADATNKELIWESSNPKVVYVDNTGKITALAADTATITVTTVDGGKKAGCVVTVKEEEIYPIVLPIAEYKLYPLYPCGWILDDVLPEAFTYDGTVYIINNSEEMNKWIRCMEEVVLPEVNFSNTTLLLTLGKSGAYLHLKNAFFVQESKMNYTLELQVFSGDFPSDSEWVFGFLVPKIEQNANIILDRVICHRD